MSESVKKILVVEDDKFLSLLLKTRLEKEGITVLQAFDGEEGLDIMKNEKPSLVVLDIITPRLSGFEVLERIRMDPEISNIPVIITSNLGQDTDVEKAKSLGAVEYYVKVQTSIDDMVEMIANKISEI